jgi:hypothetical protein
VAFEAVLGQEWAHLFLKKSDLRRLKGLSACGVGENKLTKADSLRSSFMSSVRG